MIPDYVEDKDAFLHNYLNQIDAEDRIKESLYDDRLKKCSQCRNHINGMCRLCGCFVTIRAAHKDHYCPAVIRYW